MNGGVVLLEMNYNIGIQHCTEGTSTSHKMCSYWRPSTWPIRCSIPTSSWEIQPQQWTDTRPLHLQVEYT